MTVVPSRVGLVIDQIVTLLRASPVFADPVKVYDGPDVTDDAWKDAVFIGFDGDWQGNFESAVIAQQWAYLGNTSRFEQVDIHCAAISWAGDIATKPRRDAAVALLAGVETVLRTDPSIGIDPSTIATMDTGLLYQEPFRDGHACRILFTIHAQTQISTT